MSEGDTRRDVTQRLPNGCVAVVARRLGAQSSVCCRRHLHHCTTHSASAKKFMEGGFKDLYKTDQEVISGGGSYAENAALPVFDADGSLVDGNGYTLTLSRSAQ